MATEMGLNSDAQDVAASQAGRAVNYKATWVINDTDNHDFMFRGSGKGSFTALVDIATSDQTVTYSIYGAHATDSDIGDTGVIQIGSSGSVTDGEDVEAVTVTDTWYPYYLMRLVSAGAATGSPTCTVYVNFAAY